MKEVVIKLLKKPLKELGVKITEEEIEKLLEIPPKSEMGDYAFPCFFLSEKFKSNPHEIALELREKIGSAPATDFEDVQVLGPYVNFFFNRKTLAKKLVWEVINQKKNYGKSSLGKGKKTMVEFPSPNTNKPLHLGHLRNMSIGESISRILEFNGEKVIRANLYNDRGIHVAKSMLTYKKWGKESTPETKKIKSDHFVGDYYVMFEKKKTKKLEAEAQELLQSWEAGDKNTLLLWKIMSDWAIEGFEETYKTFGIKHDVNFYENKLYQEGRDIILKGVEKKLFHKAKDGEIKVDLSEFGLGEKILLRKDGTSIYIVQDIALAHEKFKKFKIDKSLYVVGNEQEYHFKVLFEVLRKLGFKDKEMKHISYGMVNLPEGRMKSREGTVVDADDLIEKVRVMTAKELSKKRNLSKEELYSRSLSIALSAIKYMLLKVDLRKNMMFNPKESLSFEGDTGPYLQYSYARASSILKKIESTPEKKFEVYDLDTKEIELIKKLLQFSDFVASSYKSLNPSLIANYSFHIAQLFNEFYHACPVIGSKEEAFRLALTESFRQILKNSCSLLGIELMEEM